MWKQLSRVVIRQQHQRVLLARRSFVSPTAASCLAAKTINVPTMGDSITEVSVLGCLID